MSWKQCILPFPGGQGSILEAFDKAFLGEGGPKRWALFQCHAESSGNTIWLISPEASFLTEVLYGDWVDVPPPTGERWVLMGGHADASSMIKKAEY